MNAMILVAAFAAILLARVANTADAGAAIEEFPQSVKEDGDISRTLSSSWRPFPLVSMSAAVTGASLEGDRQRGAAAAAGFAGCWA